MLAVSKKKRTPLDGYLVTGKLRYNRGWAYGVKTNIYINNRGIKRVLLYYCLVFWRILQLVP